MSSMRKVVRRFATDHEIEVAGRVQHPHILPIYDYGGGDSGRYLK